MDTAKKQGQEINQGKTGLKSEFFNRQITDSG